MENREGTDDDASRARELSPWIMVMMIMIIGSLI